MWQTLVDNIKLIGSCVAGLGACAGGYVALDGPIPATKGYVVVEVQTLKGRVIDQQLQLNTVQRNLLRKEKFDRDIEIQRDPASSVRGVLQQRLEQINDELDTIEKEREKEREELRKEKVQR